MTVTKTKEGGVETYTYTKTSVFETHVPTTIHEYTTLAPHTSAIVTYVNQTSTEYVPVTEVQTVSNASPNFELCKFRADQLSGFWA